MVSLGAGEIIVTLAVIVSHKHYGFVMFQIYRLSMYPLGKVRVTVVITVCCAQPDCSAFAGAQLVDVESFVGKLRTTVVRRRNSLSILAEPP